MKKFFILFFTITLILVFPIYVFAQGLPIKSSATTIVGTGGEGVTPGEPTPGEEEPPPPPGEEPLPDCPDIDQALLQKYNIEVTNVNSCARKAVIFSAVSKAYAYPGLREKMGGAPLEFRNRNDNTKDWWGYVSGKSVVHLNRFEFVGSAEEWRFIVTHELFHVLAYRDDSQEKYPHRSLAGVDNDCFRDTSVGPVIKTYGFQTPSNAKHESFAESGALFIYERSPFYEGRINSFRSQCDDSYDWYNQYVF